MKIVLSIRQVWGKVTKRLFPQFSSCGRCGITWNMCESHSTTYKPGNRCFPLCEYCWKDLKTPQARVIYYEALWMTWMSQATSPLDVTLSQMQDACLLEGTPAAPKLFEDSP